MVAKTLLEKEIEEWDGRLLAKGGCQMLERFGDCESRLPWICTTEGALIDDTLVIDSVV
jgi:hypothetical protein